jgi:hypothetical protein
MKDLPTRVSRKIRLGVSVVPALLTACTESTIIRTNPPGASVYVNERYLGASPAEFETKSWSVRPHVYRYRVVKAGYIPQEGELPARLSIGRIVTAYLSACLSCGHGFYVFDEDAVVPLSPEADGFAVPSPDPPGWRLDEQGGRP